MTDFKQFNIWYYDFNYNDKRVKKLVESATPEAEV